MDGITIYELNERMGRAAEAGRKLRKLPMLLADATKAPDDFSNRINSIVGRIHEGAAVLYEYTQLLGEVTRAATLAWPPVCPIREQSNTDD